MASYSDYPEAVSNNAKRGIDLNEKVKVHWFIWNFENENSEWFWNDGWHVSHIGEWTIRVDLA